MSKEIALIKNPAELVSLLKKTEDSGLHNSSNCKCSLRPCTGWEPLNESNWPKDHLSHLATLRDPNNNEPTFEELQPNGVRMDDSNALISIAHFPYNRCDVFACTLCHQGVLRYTEYGGYYIDHRVRRVRSEQVISD